MQNKAFIGPQLFCPLIWLMPTVPLLLIECRGKRFNGQRSVKRNDSPDLSRERKFFFIIPMSHQKGTSWLLSLRPLPGYFLSAVLGKPKSFPFSREACSVLELWGKVKEQTRLCPQGAVSQVTEKSQEQLKEQEDIIYSTSQSCNRQTAI